MFCLFIEEQPFPVPAGTYQKGNPETSTPLPEKAQHACLFSYRINILFIYMQLYYYIYHNYIVYILK